MDTWYNKCLPLVKDVKPHLSKIGHQIKAIDGVKKVYVWGSYAKNSHKLNFQLKDIDIIAHTNLNSEDLIAINDDIISDGYLDNYLEEQGYDLSAISFSRNFMKISANNNNIDPWSISVDKKLLHWGPILSDLEESLDLNKEAEKYASLITGYNRYKNKNGSQKTKQNWYEIYSNHINKYLQDMPSGWYPSNIKKMSDIIKQSIEI